MRCRWIRCLSCTISLIVHYQRNATCNCATCQACVSDYHEWTICIIDFGPLSITVVGCKLLSNEMAGVGAGDLVWSNRWRILYHFLHQSTRVFFVEHIKGAFCYIVRNFEEFLSIRGRENALRVTCFVNILCRNLLAKIQPSPLKQVS